MAGGGAVVGGVVADGAAAGGALRGADAPAHAPGSAAYSHLTPAASLGASSCLTALLAYRRIQGGRYTCAHAEDVARGEDTSPAGRSIVREGSTLRSSRRQGRPRPRLPLRPPRRPWWALALHGTLPSTPHLTQTTTIFAKNRRSLKISTRLDRTDNTVIVRTTQIFTTPKRQHK